MRIVSTGHADRINVVHCLRGLASLLVCWFHLTNGNPSFLQPGLLKYSGKYGWVGVEIFFVISGFIVPYAMLKRGYRLDLRHYLTFITKRIIRLDPPYLTSVLLVIGLAYLSVMTPGFAGERPNYTVPQLLCHLAYLNAFFHYSWINPVFWSLAIEFQYYLSIGLLLTFITSPSRRVRYIVLGLMACTALLYARDTFITHFITLFLMGIAAFQHRVGLIRKKELLIVLSVVTGISMLTLGPLMSSVGLTTSIVIAFLDWNSKLFRFFGDISYSLYLVHVPIGGRFINLGTRFSSLSTRLAFLVAALSASVIVAYAMFSAVERPSQNLARALRLRERHPFHNTDALKEGLSILTAVPGDQ